MNNTIKPITVEEIEFYVSNDGRDTGLSQRGLARLCGISVSTIMELMTNLKVIGKTVPKELKDLQGKDLWVIGDFENNAKVVKSDFAAKIIEYYAFNSKASNETAKYSLLKFASIGIDNWIKNIVGYEEKKLSTTDELLKQLLLKFDGLEKETKELRTIRGKTKTCYVGLDTMLDSLSVEENLLPSEQTDEFEKTYTLTEWLREFKDIESLGSRAKHNLALSISQTYKQFTNEVPKKETRRDKNGKINNGVYVYTFRDFWILEKSFNLVMFPKKSQQQ